MVKSVIGFFGLNITLEKNIFFDIKYRIFQAFQRLKLTLRQKILSKQSEHDGHIFIPFTIMPRAADLYISGLIRSLASAEIYQLIDTKL